MTPNDARKTLAGMGIEFSDAGFFKYLKAGDREVVELFLDSGLLPDVRDSDRNAAVVVAARAGQKDIARTLLARGASPEPLLNVPASKKDAWDKLTASSAVLSFVSGLLIAAVGGYFTYSYNQRQIDLNHLQTEHDLSMKQEANKVLELEAIQKMIPSLAPGDDEKQKAAALTAIQDLADNKVAADLAGLFQGKGSFEYLQQAASTADPAIEKPIVQALSKIASGQSAESKLAEDSLHSMLSRPSVISYVRDGTNDHGEFRRSGQVWTETFKDLASSRIWAEVRSAAPGEIRLTDGPATIRIDLKAKAIYYSDGGTSFRRLDTIKVVSRE
jgi:hypothetical protein